MDDFEKSLAFYKDTLGLEIDSQEGKFANFKLVGMIYGGKEKINTFPGWKS
ncbi:MAG: hypothetical protein JW991_03365 [Candidatus Pacebacteria bacterium]|nr:hypothetical protein [Candidatus Paceibacterota bacterium]